MFRAPTCRILVTDCRSRGDFGQGFVKDCDSRQTVRRKGLVSRIRHSALAATVRRQNHPDRCALRRPPPNEAASQEPSDPHMIMPRPVLALSLLAAAAAAATMATAQPRG